MKPSNVAVIGGGFSGAIQAIELARRGVSVTLIERTDRAPRGVAYSTPHADHLLNVRASGMSALAGEPDHFANWFGDSNGFAERRLYGAYLEEMLAGEPLELVRGEAVDVHRDGEAETVLLSDGRRILAGAVVLSIGNLPPDVPRSIGPRLRSSAVFVGDPWARDFTGGLGPDDTVLLIGTGLTAIDAALILDSAGFAGRTIAISRRGMVPRAHPEPPPSAQRIEQVPEPRCTSLVTLVRGEAERIGWHSAVDRMRPVTQRLWAAAEPEERRRFLRHLRPYWDVHRHRIAPSIAARIASMVESGRLEFAAGKIMSASAEAVTWRRRGRGDPETLRAARIVNCTGPQGDIGRAGDPLLRNLLAAGRIRPDVCRIGIDVDSEGHLIGGDGSASPALYAIGPMTRGAWWEVIAVPDIRVQAEALAERLAA